VKNLDAKQKKLLVIAGCVALCLVILGGGYFMVVSPKKAKAATLDRQVADTQSQLVLARVAATHPRTYAGVPQLFQLSRAMPDRVDTAGAILDLVAVARASGVSLDGIVPLGPTPAVSGYQSVSITATVSGRYDQLTNFVAGLDRLVVVIRGKIAKVNGRLFGIDGIQFAEGEKRFPQIKATIKLQTYVFTTAAATPSATSTPTTTTPSNSDLSASGGTG
jgi:Tfp pilus assembly protein PilO